MSLERVTHDTSARNPRGLVSGFFAGALVVTALGLLACASAGSPSGDAGDAGDAGDEAAPTERAAQAEPVAPPPAAAPTPAPTAAPAAAPAAAATTSGGDSPVATYLADPAATQRASQLFRAVCTGYCHTSQPTVERNAPNLFDCEWDHGSSDQEIFDVIAAGVPDTQMQGFGERLPEEDLWKIVAYIRQKAPSCPGSAG